MGRLIVPLKNRTEACLFAGISALMLTYMNCHKPAGWRCVWVLFLLLNHVFILYNQLEIIWAMRDVRIACFHLRWLQGTSRQFLPSLCLFFYFFPPWRRSAWSPWRTPSAWLHLLWKRFRFLLTAWLLRIRSQMAQPWFASWMLTWTGFEAFYCLSFPAKFNMIC